MMGSEERERGKKVAFINRSTNFFGKIYKRMSLFGREIDEMRKYLRIVQIENLWIK